MNTATKENRKFGLIVGGAFMALAAYRFYKMGHINPLLAGIGITLITAGLIVPQWLTRPRRGWEKLGEVLGYINTLVLLTLVYVFVVTPLALINRLLGNDPLKLKSSPQTDTYWEPNNNDGDKTQMNRQF
ncbi:hypothetical protein C8P68_10362 [Mucilaginibacter yixingensis]|uniref:SxtJ n=1 Tax=Mucilaginibacter yixingensis TaxID=1295612 RepID=A0A2T5JAL6_9SPHI|nr:SxtJ family membrane protein [Mucilaginibacter yixingensis]PTQ97903.1 hypothetical protein C8P68_10362 [Mucilaginibacter yixingensis]